MNERIKELAVQARNHALDEKRIYERMHNTEQCMEEYREVYNKRFAELIVQDCIDILAEYRGKVIWKNEDEIQHPIFVIQKHFGVK